MGKRILVAGARGMVGSALVRRLEAEHDVVLLTPGRAEIDLTEFSAVEKYFEREQPQYVYLAAAKVGGILANNNFPVDFIESNLAIQSNVIKAAHTVDSERLLFLGSSCIYPREAEQPMREDSLLSGPLELTNEPYAIAKIAGIKCCESYKRQYGCDFRSVMPTNLYGTNDNFHPENSHVIPGLMNRFHDAIQQGKDTITIWGSGKPKREFLHVDDLADACVHMMNLSAPSYWEQVSERCSHVNIGTGSDCSIRELAELLKKVTGFSGSLVFDTSKPDGTPRKLLDVSLADRLGWRSSISLESGLASTWSWFQENYKSVRA